MKRLLTHLIAIGLGIVIATALLTFLWPKGGTTSNSAAGRAASSASPGQTPFSPSTNPPGSAPRPALPATDMLPPIGPGPAPGVGSGGAMPPPNPSEAGSPYSAYPLSFPKIFAGIVYIEEKHPDLAVTAEQCEAILPVVETMGEIWRDEMDLAKKLQRLLTPEQEHFILENKKDLETTTGTAKAASKLNNVLKSPAGAFPAGGALLTAMRFCDIRAAESGQSETGARAKGDVLITQYDIASGILLMEDHPALKITPRQAKYMKPLFRAIQSLDEVVSNDFGEILGHMKKEQVAIVTSEIKEITELKFKIFADAPKERKREPLFEKVTTICRSKTSHSLDLF